MNKNILVSLKEIKTHINSIFLRPLLFFKHQALIKQLKTVLKWGVGQWETESLFVEDRFFKFYLDF